MLTENQISLLNSILEIEHYQSDNGRIYYLKENGSRRYIRHDPVAKLMQRGIISIDSNKIFVTKWGKILLEESKN